MVAGKASLALAWVLDPLGKNLWGHCGNVLYVWKGGVGGQIGPVGGWGWQAAVEWARGNKGEGSTGVNKEVCGEGEGGRGRDPVQQQGGQ